VHLVAIGGRVDPVAGRVTLLDPGRRATTLPYDKLIIGTGALPTRPPIDGLSRLTTDNGVFMLHSIADMLRLARAIDREPGTALIVGAGYIGLEMAEALTQRGLRVTQVEALEQVLPTVDPSLGAHVRSRLTEAGVDVITSTRVDSITLDAAQLRVQGRGLDRRVDLVLVVTGVRPNTAIAEQAGARLGVGRAVQVDQTMAAGVPQVWAAGDCVITHDRLLGETYLSLGTTAHKQGRAAGENALGGSREFAGSLGTQVVKVFDLAAPRTGLREDEARAAGYAPVSVETVADDHKAYYPGAHPLTISVTADHATRRLLGVQIVGHKDRSVAKRIDIAAAAIHQGMTVDDVSDLDLSYTPPLGSPWDAVQSAAQAWERAQITSAHHTIAASA